MGTVRKKMVRLNVELEPELMDEFRAKVRESGRTLRGAVKQMIKRFLECGNDRDG